MYVYLPNTSHFIHFKQFDKRNKSFIRRLINISGTYGQIKIETSTKMYTPFLIGLN